MKNKKVEAFLYPDVNEEKDTKLIKEKLDIHINEIHQAGISNVISVGHDSRWNTNDYRDGIHPSGKGNEILADIISKPEPQDLF
jgi:lysophospholipase L1-like esterase